MNRPEMIDTARQLVAAATLVDRDLAVAAESLVSALEAQDRQEAKASALQRAVEWHNGGDRAGYVLDTATDFARWLTTDLPDPQPDESTAALLRRADSLLGSAMAGQALTESWHETARRLRTAIHQALTP